MPQSLFSQQEHRTLKSDLARFFHLSLLVELLKVRENSASFCKHSGVPEESVAEHLICLVVRIIGDRCAIYGNSRGLFVFLICKDFCRSVWRDDIPKMRENKS